MAGEFNIIESNRLPETLDVTGATIIVIQGGVVKRARSQLMKGEKGDSVFLDVSDTAIQWKQGAEGNWQNLISIEEITGPKGEKPIFQKSSTGIDYKYENEGDDKFRPIVAFSDLALTWEDLTPEQIDELTLHFTDLTEDQIKELQKPAIDAAASVSELEETINLQEESRVSAEEGRVSAEKSRVTAESKRVEVENNRVEAERLRVQAEGLRVEAEQKRETAEENRVEAEQIRAEAETTRNSQEEERQENTTTAIQNADTATERLNNLSDHRDYVDDLTGNWFRWNEEKKKYEDTGVKGRGNVMYATFEVDPMTGVLTMTTPDGYTGPVFSLVNNDLIVTIQ